MSIGMRQTNQLNKLGKDQSLYSDNKTSDKVRIGVRNSGPSATTLCNAYNKAKKDNPLLVFSEWKKEYMREYWRKKRDKGSKRGS